MNEARATRTAAAILIGITFFEGCFVVPPLVTEPQRLLTRLGFLPGPHTATPLGWFLALSVAAAFIAFSCRLPSVRANMVRISGLKLVAVALAIVAGILEEYYFRGMLMDWGLHRGWNSLEQILFSGLTFGLAHGIWAFFRGSVSTGIGAVVVTGGLGALLAVVYLASARSLAPVVTSHFLINLLIEPGLVLAAVRGEMRRQWRQPGP